MAELEVSIINSSINPSIPPETTLRNVVGNFNERHHAKVNYKVDTWDIAWAEIMKTVLYKRGPSMSQIGTTWLGSLESTQALRSFTPTEFNQLGGLNAYYPAVLKPGISAETGRVTAIPWIVDVYVLYYRKDLLQKAGVDEARAFETLDAFTETVRKLYQARVSIPFGISTADLRLRLHNVAGWVWSYGGDFVSADGKNLLLSDPKTRSGLKAYFSLFKYMPKAAQTLTDADCYNHFLNGTAAIVLGNSRLLYEAQNNPLFANHLGDFGVAAVPGTNFVGGSSFVLWNHIGRMEELLALELLHEISLPETQLAYFQQTGLLPARIEALNTLAENPLYIPIVQTLMTGRPYTSAKLWGLIEQRLSVALAQIWQALYANENANVDEEIAKVLDPLERRLQLTLSDS